MQTNADQKLLVRLYDHFYRDGFKQLLFIILLEVIGIALLIMLSLYFFLHQVLPVTFHVQQDWRVQGDVSLDRPYIATADLVQWVSTVVPTLFYSDFLNYTNNVQTAYPYFTSNGWAKYIELANTYVNQDEVTKKKEFVTANVRGAPVILNQGLVNGSYAWWVQIPINVIYSGVDGTENTVRLTLQVLVVRISTLNNLDGVAIDNIIHIIDKK